MDNKVTMALDECNVIAKIGRYYSFDKAISSEDCDAFLEKYKKFNFESGAIWKFDDTGEKNKSWSQNQENVEISTDKRDSAIYWADINDAVVVAMWACVLEANQHYKLNIKGYTPAQITRYEEGSFYDWHQDSFYHAQRTVHERKISAILQLSKPEDYEGGELQLFNGQNDPEILPIKDQGSVIVFRSEEWHRVTKLIKGTRYSLVFWSVGDPLV